METERTYSLLLLLHLLLVPSFTFLTFNAEAAKCGNYNNGRRSLSSPGQPPPTQSDAFDLASFGAKGDGVSDDSEALVAAWEAACQRVGATLRVPPGLSFLIKPLTLQGPCMPHLVLQIDGTLLAPPEVGSWPRSSSHQWINFKWVHNFTILGTGTVDGQGSNWWTPSQSGYIQKGSKQVKDMKPTAVRFYGSNNVTICGIKIVNSPQCHLKFDNSTGVEINNVTISAPESSPNTDGIHLQDTRDVEIQHSNIGCGDDCVSIQTGCSNVHVHHLNCGPGHGISLGSLGKDKSKACVSNINVEDIFMQNTLWGVRIKTWQGGTGLVNNVTFSNIRVTDVRIPITIDQYYCDKGFCKNQTDAVAITDIKYENIIGTYSIQPIRLTCSNDIPCTDVDLVDIQLRPSLKYRDFQNAFCWNSYGKSQPPLAPSSMDYCLRGNGLPAKGIAKSPEKIC